MRCVHMTPLKIIYKDPTHLKPRPNNPRTHTPRQLQQIVASITQFGFITPVLIDRSDNIIAGHARVNAAKTVGIEDIPTVRVDHLSPTQIRAYVIADNRLAENAGWDRHLLALELKELSIELDFDVTVTGFETAEIDLLVKELNSDTDSESDCLELIDRQSPPTSRIGDLWHVGNHRILCADALERKSYATLLENSKAQMVFIDPPFNVPIANNVSGLGKVKHREFAMASGEMSREQFIKLLKIAAAHLISFSRDGSIHFICMDWRHIGELYEATTKYTELKNLCVWAKTNAGMGSFYRSQHELIFVFKNGKRPHINNIELGRFGRNRSNVWQYAGVNTFTKERQSELSMHPTVKPTAMVVDAVLDCSKRGGIILDAFAGSGTTLVAAEKTGRRGYGIEFDPYYVDTIIRRMETAYGLKATLDNGGLHFAALTISRAKGAVGGKKAGKGKKL